MRGWRLEVETEKRRKINQAQHIYYEMLLGCKYKNIASFHNFQNLLHVHFYILQLP